MRASTYCSCCYRLATILGPRAGQWKGRNIRRQSVLERCAITPVQTSRELLSPAEFRRELNALVDSRNCVKHPFIEAWAEGQLTRPQLAAWVREAHHFTKDGWAYLSAIYSNCPEPEGRAALIGNLTEETDPDDPHPEILLAFARACGLDPEEIERTPALPTTWGMKDWLTLVTTRRGWVEALAGVSVGMESQNATIMPRLLPALRGHYGFSEDEIRYFTVHGEADVEHGGRSYDLVAKFATTPELQNKVRQAVMEGTQRRWLWHDGLYIKHILGYPIDALSVTCAA